jgi:hypothetical protein
MQTAIQQEPTEETETGKEISVISVSSCSNAFSPAGSRHMSPRLEQEIAEVAESFSMRTPLSHVQLRTQPSHLTINI